MKCFLLDVSVCVHVFMKIVLHVSSFSLPEFGTHYFFIQGGIIGNGLFDRELREDTKLKFFYHHGLMGTT